jgi:2-oxo-4-hydroxy-4-carboxy-5-ureidoimidazoline decarboxylase
MPEPHVYLNALASDAAAAALARCCGAARWVEDMLALRPFASCEALYDAADRVWSALSVEEQLQAFAHHPRIGARAGELERRFASTAALSSREQSGVASASAQVLEALRAGNAAYEERFGFVFLVCASGKGAQELLALLHERLAHDRATELRIAAAEHAKITRLRLAGLAS